jgi:hypothetical protein
LLGRYLTKPDIAAAIGAGAGCGHGLDLLRRPIRVKRLRPPCRGPAVTEAHPASAKTTKSAARHLGQCISPPDRRTDQHRQQAEVTGDIANSSSRILLPPPTSHCEPDFFRSGRRSSCTGKPLVSTTPGAVQRVQVARERGLSVGKGRSLRRYRVAVLPASEINDTGLIKRRCSEQQEAGGVSVGKDVPSVTTDIRELGASSRARSR